MRSLYKIFGVILLSMGCNNSTDSDQSSGLASEFMPLKVGNRWYYKAYNNNDVIDTIKESYLTEVIGKTEINNQSYYTLVNKYIYNSKDSLKTLDTFYYRCEWSKLFKCYIHNAQVITYLEADFSLSKNQSYQIKFGPDGTDLKVTIINKDSTTIKLYYDVPGSADEEMTNTFKLNVGLFDIYSVAWGNGLRLSRVMLK